MTVISNTVICATPRRNAFTLALHSLTLIAFMVASSVPTPLYRLYQHDWGIFRDAAYYLSSLPMPLPC